MQQPDDPGPQQIIREVHHYHGGGEGQRPSFGRMIDSILPAAIIGLVGVVWMLSNSVTKLTEQVSSLAKIQNDQYVDLRSEISDLKSELKTQP